MKTLIISGTVSKSVMTETKLMYNLCLFGQSPEQPLCQVIQYIDLECDSYTSMQDEVRKIYARYFNTDLFNITTIENILMK